jgi:hypothetical protein
MIVFEVLRMKAPSGSLSAASGAVISLLHRQRTGLPPKLCPDVYEKTVQITARLSNPT